MTLISSLAEVLDMIIGVVHGATPLATMRKPGPNSWQEIKRPKEISPSTSEGTTSSESNLPSSDDISDSESDCSDTELAIPDQANVRFPSLMASLVCQ